MPLILILLLVSLSTFVPANIAVAEPNNSCIECHKALPAGSYAGHKFSDYTGSVHERNGIRCEACHGGDPMSADKTTAHTGVFRSSNPRSSIYFKNLPQMCGNCHGEER